MELNDYHAAGNIWQLIIVSIHGVSGSKLEIYGDIEIRNGFMNYGPLCSNTDSGPYDPLQTSFFSEYTAMPKMVIPAGFGGQVYRVFCENIALEKESVV